MKRCFEQEAWPSTASDYWVRYWHQIWRTQPQSLARNHLFAYLQEPCYQIAEKFWSRYYSHFPQDKIEDYFQSAIAKTDKFLSRFDPQYPTANFRGLATIVFYNRLIDDKRLAVKYFGLTDWSLLKVTSPKKFTEALHKYGFSESMIHSYRLAWDCYKAIYAPMKEKSNNKFKEPDSLIWKKIVQAYHQQKTPQDLDCNSQIISAWLKTCAIAIRHSEAPSIESLNQTILEGSEVELQDKVSSDRLLENIDPLTDTNDIAQQIHSILLSFLQELMRTQDGEVTLIFQLYYCQKPQLRQAEIAQRVFGDGNQQYKVSRRLDQIKRKLLTFLSQWAAATFNISLNSEIMQSLNLFLNDWLNNYSQDICNQLQQ